jgi:hypothetical protein
MRGAVLIFGIALIGLLPVAAGAQEVQALDTARELTSAVPERRGVFDYTLSHIAVSTLDGVCGSERSRESRAVRVCPTWTASSQSAQQTATVERKRGLGRIIAGAAVGGTAGFFAGGYTGAWIDGECDCDDPGLMGALIGAPIGATLGAIFGGLYLF